MCKGGNETLKLPVVILKDGLRASILMSSSLGPIHLRTVGPSLKTEHVSVRFFPAVGELDEDSMLTLLIMTAEMESQNHISLIYDAMHMQRINTIIEASYKYTVYCVVQLV